MESVDVVESPPATDPVSDRADLYRNISGELAEIESDLNGLYAKKDDLWNKHHNPSRLVRGQPVGGGFKGDFDEFESSLREIQDQTQALYARRSELNEQKRSLWPQVKADLARIALVESAPTGSVSKLWEEHVAAKTHRQDLQDKIDDLEARRTEYLTSSKRIKDLLIETDNLKVELEFARITESRTHLAWLMARVADASEEELPLNEKFNEAQEMLRAAEANMTACRSNVQQHGTEINRLKKLIVTAQINLNKAEAAVAKLVG